MAVDDEIAIANSISDALEGQGYQVSQYTDPRVAFESIARQTFDLALIDINMPGISGETLAREFARNNREAEIIIITGIPDEQNIDVFLKQGIKHFLFKPFNKLQLVYTVYAALHYQRIRKSLAVATSGTKGSKLIGISPSIRRLREEISIFAEIDIPIIITGESGTGKEIIAHEIHKFSHRSSNLFLPINCATLDSLAESEFFGHAKGAFTGSTSTTPGYVGTAEGGTLFLDEVGELPLDIQAKLLRFLDTGEYIRVGESKLRYADVRILAATNRNLEEMCNKGQFREDLFYRLSGSVLKTDPLSLRKEDIMPLIYHFLSELGSSQNTTYEISGDAAARLVENQWPGNVRQLKQALLKLTSLAVNNRILFSDVIRITGEGEQKQHPHFKEAKQKAVEDFERNYLLRTLQLAQGNLKRALELSGMHKKNFYTKINKLGLLLKDFRQQSIEKK